MHQTSQCLHLPFPIPFPAQCVAHILQSMLVSPWQQLLQVLHSLLQQHVSLLPTCPIMLQNHSWMQQDLVQTFADTQPNMNHISPCHDCFLPKYTSILDRASSTADTLTALRTSSNCFS